MIILFMILNSKPRLYTTYVIVSTLRLVKTQRSGRKKALKYIK